MSTPVRGRVRVAQGAKRVRVFLGGELVADTVHPLLVWEVPYYPTYYFPRADVVSGVFTPSGRTTHSPSRGDGVLSTIKVGRAEAVDAALEHPDSPIEELRDHVRFDFAAFDWFEEDEQIFTHPRDPGVRVDILPSSRHVRIEVDGVTVADSVRPHLLFETGLPVRYYLPRVDVRMDLLEKIDTVTHCPYKGAAEHFDVAGHADLAWSYPTPLPESSRAAGLVAFLDEKVDVFVDGVRQERPKTKFA
ncbi:uncharacterized protein (DUF427 family) [Amycolatopsis lexingtonensis]|uniref:Uncharacterized protein (DUF427 family) n=1 Tax=Amycolatopsis lexingtonensis TaxID=218822 RepID=A0ABR9HZZ1_9PSEU|nr:DUF427 domain-containing protein [Amycolatopsis lexingtonensis]MBE1496475.1 uncharacterized protein (DUF427 family) [Amycolatopsis lexingtonensis]